MSNLQKYADKLGAPDEVERLYAAEDLGYLNSPEGVDLLVSRLAEETSQCVREAIFQALIRSEGEAPIAGSISLLTSDSALVRNEAVRILRRKGEAAIPFLQPAMRHGNKGMRKLVLDVLAGLSTTPAEDIYNAALHDDDPNVVITAVENLGRIGAPEFRTRIEALLECEKVPMLSAACLEALAGIGNPASLPAIRRRFPDIPALPDFLLIPCLHALGALGTEGEFEEAGSLLSARRITLHSAALGAMLTIAWRGCVPVASDHLLATLREIVSTGPMPLCQYQATQLLGLWAARDDVSAFLIQCFDSPEPLVRSAAGEALRPSNRIVPAPFSYRPLTRRIPPGGSAGTRLLARPNARCLRPTPTKVEPVDLSQAGTLF